MSEQTASAKAKAETSGRKISRSSSSSKTPNVAPKASLNMQELRELAELVNEHGFTDFEFENENIRIRLSKTAPAQFVQAIQPMAASAPVSAPQSAAAGQSSAAAENVSGEAAAADSDADLFKITSPIVGTFYRSPSPDKDPYVQEGDKVSESTVVCIVEAMKLMNEIQAETSGEIVKIYVENGQPVEYGQPLFGIRK
jgi:acetyl-CoA carboxylase biotin carboxyl carrier protein